MTSDGLQQLDFEGIARDLAATGDYRVLRRLNVPSGPCCTGGDADTLVGLAIDLETTGLDPRRHCVIEATLRRFRFDANGVITKIDRPYTWLEDPGEPLDPVIARLTGLTDDKLRGQRIDERMATALARSAHVACSFNAAFDRPFFERRLPSCAGMAWACALKDIDWRNRGFDGSGRSLGWILAQCGWFHGAHRAEDDVDALIAILRHVDGEGRTACSEMTATAVRPGWRFRAVGANFHVKDMLKARGYAWDGEESVWVREVPDHAREDEAAWLAAEVYAPERRPKLDTPAIDEVTWFTRYAHVAR